MFETPVYALNCVRQRSPLVLHINALAGYINWVYRTRVLYDAPLNCLRAFAPHPVVRPADRISCARQEETSAKPRYKGTFHALATIAKTESVGSLWTGFPPYLLAKGTLTVILFIIKEQYTTLAKWICSGGLKSLLAK